MESIVITGASTGIGYATAKYCIERNMTVFGSVRSQEDADRISKELGSHFVPLLFDITEEDKVNLAAQQVRKQLQGKKLCGLINNAGISVAGPLLYMPVHDFRKQLEINLVGQFIVSKAFIPLLGSDQTLTGEAGKIINISSVAGKRALPFMSAYATSKHGLEGFSEGLRRELMPFGIDVIIVGPGAIKTPIWAKANKTIFSEETMQSVYGKAVNKLKGLVDKLEKSALPAESVASLIYSILKQKHPKVRYAPVPNKFIHWTIPNLLPKRFIDKIIRKQFGF
jgi:short-subunit dehydrogenase